MNLKPSDYDKPIDSFVLSQALRNAIPNTLFYGAIALITIFVGGYWPIVGKVVCVLFGILLAVEIVRHTVSSLSTIALCFKEGAKGEGTMLLALLVQVLETAVFAFFFWLLLRQFFLS